MIPAIFGAPAWAISGGIVGAAVIAAFFYRRRSRVVEVPAVTVWRRVGRPLDVRSVSTLLRSLCSLAVQLLIVGLLAAALANPFPAKTLSRRIAIVIDAGATMQTREPSGSSRFDQARELARQQLEAAPSDAETTLIVAAHGPLVAGRGTTAPADAIEQLRTLHPLDVESDLPAALRAASFLRNDESATVVVYSDFSGTPTETLRAVWTGSAKLDFRTVGSDQPDAAITNLWAEQLPIADQSPATAPTSRPWRIGATIRSRGLSGRSTVIRLISSGKTVASNNIELNDDTANSVDLLATLPSGADYEVLVDSGDALSVDDRALGVLPPKRRGICLVTRGNAALEHALSADSAIPLRVVTPDRFDGPRDESVVVFDDAIVDSIMRPADGSQIGYLMIGAADPFGLATTDGAAIVPGRATQWAADHPILADVEPDLISIRRALSLKPRRGTHLVSLVAAENAPLIVEAQTASSASTPPQQQQKFIYWLFNLDDTDLPTRLTFPVLLWNTIDYLVGTEYVGRESDGEVRTGNALTVDSRSSPPEALSPSGKPLEVRRIGQRFAIDDVAEQGFYTIFADGISRRVAVDLLSDRGTRVLPRSDGELDRRSSRVSKITTKYDDVLRRPSWRLLVAVTVALASIEWFLFHRRVVRVG